MKKITRKYAIEMFRNLGAMALGHMDENTLSATLDNFDKFRNRISTLKQSGDKRLRFEREKLYAKVKQLEADIATLENNIGFFATSKGAESLMADVRSKIAKAKEEMAETIKKVQAIDAAENSAE